MMQINILCPFQLIWVYKIFHFYDLYTTLISIHCEDSFKNQCKNKLHINEREEKSTAMSYYTYYENGFIAQVFYYLLLLNH